MSAGNLESRIARLRCEIERLSAEQAEKMKQQDTGASGAARKLEARRAEILTRRLRQLNEMLEALKREKLR